MKKPQILKPVQRSKHKQIEMATFLNQRNLKVRLTHGGSSAHGRRKEYRPLSTKSPIHLVLRASKAKGKLSLLQKNNRIFVEQTFRKQARKYGVALLKLVNVGNHLHVEVKITARKEFQNFLRSVTCLVARKITGAKRGKRFGRFWDHLAFTRVVKSRYEQRILKTYFLANSIEAIGGPMARAQFLDAWYGFRPPDNPILI